MKQSSINYFSEKTYELFNQLQDGIITFSFFRNKIIIFEIEAKEMHKQEVIDANNRGYKVGRRDIFETAEQYYNETYNIKS